MKKTLLKIFTLVIACIILKSCASSGLIHHPLIVYDQNRVADTCYFFIPPKHHFQVLVDDHFNFSWLVIVPDNYDITEEMWRDKRIWLKRNVYSYSMVTR